MWIYADSSYPVLGNPLFGAAELVKNANIDKSKYSGYTIGFNVKGKFSFPAGEFVKNVIFLGLDINSSVYVDIMKKDILILGEGHAQRLDDTTLTSE